MSFHCYATDTFLVSYFLNFFFLLIFSFQVFLEIAIKVQCMLFIRYSYFHHFKSSQSISCHWSLSIPPENIRKSEVFWGFQGVSKRRVVWNRLKLTLREKCPNTDFFLVWIFLYSNWGRSSFWKLILYIRLRLSGLWKWSFYPIDFSI